MGEIIRKEGLMIDREKRTWEGAIRVCGDFMVSLGSTKKEYTQAMIDAVNTFGPYIVIGPGIAFAHAATGSSVLKNDLVLAAFKEPVVFGCDNDPVHLMFGLCATEPESHLELLGLLSEVIESEELCRNMIDCESVDGLYKLLNN